MPLPIQMLVIVSLFLSIFAGWNLSLHSLTLCLLHNGIPVVAFIGNQVLGADSFNETGSFCAICPGSFCSNNLSSG